MVLGKRGPKSEWDQMSRDERTEYELKREWCAAKYRSMPHGTYSHLVGLLGRSSSYPREILDGVKNRQRWALDKIYKFICEQTGDSMRPGVLGAIDQKEAYVRLVEGRVAALKMERYELDQRIEKQGKELWEARKELARVMRDKDVAELGKDVAEEVWGEDEFNWTPEQIEETLQLLKSGTVGP